MYSAYTEKVNIFSKRTVNVKCLNGCILYFIKNHELKVSVSLE